MSAVAVTGLGCIGAPGRGLAVQRAALAAGRCGLRRRADPAYPLAADLALGWVTDTLPDAPGRAAALGLAAARDALADAGTAASQGRVDLLVATTTAGMSESEAVYLAGVTGDADPVFRRHPPAATAAAIAAGLGLETVAGVHCVACASAACALADAVERLRQGESTAVLVVACDANTRLTMAGFHSLQVIDAAGCRPLLCERAGMSLGEGAAALLLEDPARVRARAGATWATVCGWGMRADGHHATAPHPEGRELEAAVRAALDDAGVSPAAIDYVNAHGTGTRDNDAAEAAAFARLFPDRVPVASSKRVYGHTMGATAAIEAVACCLALAEGQRWPSAGAADGIPIPGLRLQTSCEAAPLRHALSTTLAFGGVDVALVFGRGEGRSCA